MDMYSSNEVSGITLKKHMIRTYGLMFAGVLLTFAVAFLLSTNESLMLMFLGNSMMPWILLIAQLGVVIVLSARITKLSEGSAKVLFFAYAVLTGITFSVLGLIYAGTTIASAFLITCIFFGCLVLIGSTTRMDLTKIGTICIAGLIAMIFYSVLSMLFGWGMNYFMYSCIGLVLFMGITAWDAQKIKTQYNQYAGDEAFLRKMGIYSALSLYLDFINIFLYILRILGSKD